MYNLAQAEEVKHNLVETHDNKTTQNNPTSNKIISQKVEKRDKNPKNEDINEDFGTEQVQMTPEKSSIPEMVKPVKKKEIPSVAPVLGQSNKTKDRILPFDDNMFPPSSKIKLPPLDPRKLPPIENKPKAPTNIGLPKNDPLEKIKPVLENIIKDNPVPVLKADPLENISGIKQPIGTDSSLGLSEGAMLEAQDYVSDMFSKTKQAEKSKNVPFKYQQSDGGDLNSLETKEITGIKSTSGNNPGSSFMTEKIKGFQMPSETESDGNNIGRRASQIDNEVSERMENTQDHFYKAEEEKEKCGLDKLNSPGMLDHETTPKYIANERLSTVTISEGNIEVARDYVT